MRLISLKEFMQKLPDLRSNPTTPLRITLHWTGGGLRPTGNDMIHYHYLIDGQGGIHQGADIRSSCPIRKSTYAAHTAQCNSNNIGVALCGMHDATEGNCRAGNFGKHALTEASFTSAIAVCAGLCKRYSIPVSETRLLGHSEWQSILGKQQRGKWDVTCIPHRDIRPGENLEDGRAPAMRWFRGEVLKLLQQG